MVQNSSKDLCLYRVRTAIETLETAKMCIETKHYKDAVNRSYYAAFHAVRAVLAMEKIDFKRHKDVIAYFNKTYVATEIFEKTIGRILAQLQLKREKSDYDDFFVVSKEEAETQYQNAVDIFNAVKKYLSENHEITI